MKRKIFSKLLMVALVIAAVGSFVSCKDYDDDINNLQKQIDNAALKSDLTALQQTLTSVQSTASTAAADATSALTKAGANASDIAALQTKANELGTQIAAAAQNATKGIEDAADAAAAAAAAQTAAEAAQTAAQEAKDAIAPAVEAAIAEATEKFNAAIGAKADTAAVKALATKLADAEENIAAAGLLIAANAAAIDALETKAEDFESRIAALEAKASGEGAAEAMEWTTAITGVQLFGQVWAGVDFTLPNLAAGLNLNFLHGQVKLNSIFGNNEDAQGEQGKAFEVFTDKDSIRVENAIIVKVDPVNAQLTSDMIKLVDSQGNNLNDFVEFGTPVAYDNLITITRADNKTGLWVLPVALKDNITEDVFNNEVIVNYKKKIASTATRQYKAYAVALNNTKTAGRDIVSTYDITAISGDYVQATELNFKVNTKAVADIHNRWDAANKQVVGEDGTSKTIKNPEYEWLLDEDDLDEYGLIAPDTAIAKNADGDMNVIYSADDRRAMPCLEVSKDVAFKINFTPDEAAKVKSFYVVLDKGNAVESAPSEINAWNSYKYEGLNTMAKTSEGLNITISEGSKDPEHDIIGFRVYGVNYDGTLADPDGRAFYVQVGGAVPANQATIKSKATVEWTAKSTTATDNVSGFYELVLPEDGFETSTVAGTFTIKAKDYPDEILEDITVNYALYSAAAADKQVANWKDAKFIKITGVSKPGYWRDSADPIEVVIEAGSPAVNSIALKIDKLMPSVDATGIAIKSGADVTGTNVKVYMEPADPVATTAADPLLGGGTAYPTAARAAGFNGTKALFGIGKLYEIFTFDKKYAWTLEIAGIKPVKKATATAAPTEYKMDKWTVSNALNTDFTNAQLTVAVPANDVVVKEVAGATTNKYSYELARWTGAISNTSSKTLTVLRTYADISTVDDDGDEMVYGATYAPNDYKKAAATYSVYFCDPWAAQTVRTIGYQYISKLTQNATTATRYDLTLTESNSYMIDYNATAGNPWFAADFTPQTATWGTGNTYPYGTAKIAFTAPTNQNSLNTVLGTAFYQDADVTAGYFNAGALAGMPINGAHDAGTGFDYVTLPLANFLTQSNSIYPNSAAYNKAFDASDYIADLMISERNAKVIAQQTGGTVELDGQHKQKVSAVLTGDAADYYFAWPNAGGTSVSICKYTDAPATIAKDITGTITLKTYTAFGNQLNLGTITFTVKH